MLCSAASAAQTYSLSLHDALPISLAIACGNTFILKPSEKVPSASVRMAELFKQAGLPDGVLNVIHGDKAAVDALLSQDRKSTRLNSSHRCTSYAVFCLKTKIKYR